MKNSSIKLNFSLLLYRWVLGESSRGTERGTWRSFSVTDGPGLETLRTFFSLGSWRGIDELLRVNGLQGPLRFENWCTSLLLRGFFQIFCQCNKWSGKSELEAAAAPWLAPMIELRTDSDSSRVNNPEVYGPALEWNNWLYS